MDDLMDVYAAAFPSKQQAGMPYTSDISAPQSAGNSNPISPQERKASNNTSHTLNSRSCVTCRRRKVKCDKIVPCSNCTKAQTQCIFPAPGRAPRRPRQGPKVVSEREAELLERLRRLEGVVEDLSGQVDVEAAKHSPGSDQSSQLYKDGDATTDSGKSVRVVGMDEGKKNWINRTFNLGEGPPKSAFKLKGVMGRLSIDEGKSQYVSNPFWATIAEVCINV
jgi:hypothetical protein